MVSTFTTNVSIEKPANGDYVNTWSTPVNTDWDIIDTCIGGTTSLNVTGASGTTVLTVTQYRARLFKISGTLTANVIYQVPSGIGGFWFFQNSTTGAFTVTISSGGAGTSLVLPQGYTTPATSDGTNIAIGYSAPSTVSAAGSDTQVQFNSSGSLGASSNLTWNSATNTLAATNITGTLTGNVTGNVTGTATNVSGTVTVAHGGTGGTTQATARTGLGAAASGANTDITSLSNGVTLAAVGTQSASTLGYLGLPVAGTKTVNYASILSDQSKAWLFNGSSLTATIPANSSIAFPVGTILSYVNLNATALTVSITTDTMTLAGTTSTGNRTVAQNGIFTAIKTSATTWLCSGPGVV